MTYPPLNLDSSSLEVTVDFLEVTTKNTNFEVPSSRSLRPPALSLSRGGFEFTTKNTGVNAFRVLVRLPRYCSASGMFADAGVDDFYAIMRRKSASLIRQIRSSGNKILKMNAESPESPVWNRFIKLHIL